MPRCRWWDVEDFSPWIKKFNYAFEYDETSESFLRWKNTQSYRCKPGDVAGTLHRSGYWDVRFELKIYRVHQIIWIMHNNTIPEPLSVDHADQKRTNNNINNLRLATQSVQNMNRKPRNKYRGVSSKGKKWRARIWDKGKQIQIGTFKNEIEAARAWDAEAIKLGRTDLNFP